MIRLVLMLIVPCGAAGETDSGWRRQEFRLPGDVWAIIPADETTLDVFGAGVFVTSANTKTTAITDLTNAIVGQTVRIIGGSDENPSTIADDGKFRLSGAWTASIDDVLILLVLHEDRFVELGRVDN